MKPEEKIQEITRLLIMQRDIVIDIQLASSRNDFKGRRVFERQLLKVNCLLHCFFYDTQHLN